MSENEKLGAGVAEDRRSGSENEDALTYPAGLNLAILTLALCLALFLVALVSQLVCCLALRESAD